MSSVSLFFIHFPHLHQCFSYYWPGVLQLGDPLLQGGSQWGGLRQFGERYKVLPLGNFNGGYCVLSCCKQPQQKEGLPNCPVDSQSNTQDIL